MPATRLTRRASLLLPFVLAACGGGEEPPRDFPPLRYTDYPPIRLNVAGINIEQRFFPSNLAPNVNEQDPAKPVAALRAMAEDRLQTMGATGQAVFGITNASVTRVGDVLTCSLAVVLEIYGSPGVRSGFAEASVSREHRGPVDDLPTALYDLTKAAMNAMNVEFEFQVRRNLQEWVVPTGSMPSPVQAQPLETPPPPGSLPPGSPPPPGSLPPGSPPPGSLPPPSPLSGAPPAGPPTSLPPPTPMGPPPGQQ